MSSPATRRGVKIDAVQIVARLFRRDGEVRLVDQALQVGALEREFVRHLARRKIGKVAFRQRLQGEARTAGAYRQRCPVAGKFQNDLRALRQLAHDVIEHMGGHRGRSAGAASAAIASVTSRSRSVAFRLSVARSARRSTLARMGMVLRRSTARCTCPSDRNNSERSTVTFIATSVHAVGRDLVRNGLKPFEITRLGVAKVARRSAFGKGGSSRRRFSP